MSDDRNSALPGGRRKHRPTAWNPGPEKPAATDNLWWQRGLGLGGVIACAGLIAWMISWLFTPPPPVLVVFGDAPRPADLSAPFHIAGWATARLFATAAEDASAEKNARVHYLANRAGPGPTPLDDWNATLDELARPKLASFRRASSLRIAYFSQPGAADADGPYLLTASGKKVHLSQLLDKFRNADLSKSLVVLAFDPVAETADAVPGVPTNTFAEALSSLADKPGALPDGVVVICGSGRGQVSHASDEWRATAFGHFFRAALETRAAEGGDVGLLTLGGVFDWTAKRTRDWAALNRESATGRAAQTPLVFTNDRQRVNNLNFIAWNRDRGEPGGDEAPGRDFTADDRSRVEKAWAKVDELAAAVPGPEVYTPVAWARLRHLTWRYEQLVRFGEPTRALDGELAELAKAIETGRELPVRPEVWAASLAMPAALGLDRGTTLQKPNSLVSAKNLFDEARRAAQSPEEALRDARACDAVLAAAPGANRIKWLADGVREVSIDVARRSPEWHFVTFWAGAAGAAATPDAPAVRRLAERVAVAVDPSAAKPAHPYSEWLPTAVRQRIAAADRHRRSSEDHLFSPLKKDHDRAATDLEKARTEYQAIADAQKPLRDALAARDLALAELPWLTRWMLAGTAGERRDDANVLIDLWKQTRDLRDRLAKLDPRLPNAETPDAEALRSLTQSVRGELEQLVGLYRGEAERERRSTELQAKHLRDINLLTSGPPPQLPGEPTAKVRADLLDRARRISRKLLDEESRAKLLDEVPASAGDADTQAFRDRLSTAAGWKLPVERFDPARDEPSQVERRERWRSLLDWLAQRQLLDHWTDADKPFSSVRAEALYKPWKAEADNAKLDANKRDQLAAVNEAARQPLLSGRRSECFRDTKQLAVGFRLSGPPSWAEPGAAAVSTNLSSQEEVKFVGDEPGVKPLNDEQVTLTRQIQRVDSARGRSEVALSATAFYRGRNAEARTVLRTDDKPYLVLSRPSPAPVASVAARGGSELITGSVAIILDCSGSMNAQGPEGRRFDQALKGLRTLLESLPDGTRFSVRVFSNAENGKYQEQTLFIRPTVWNPQNLSRIMNELSALVPFGDTPLSAAMAQASVQELTDSGMSVGQKNLVVLTDGKEETYTADFKATVPSKPEQIASRLVGLPANTAVHLVLFDVGDDDLSKVREQFQSLAFRVPAGTIRRATGLTELRQVLLDSLRPKLRVGTLPPPPDGFPTIRPVPPERNPGTLNAELQWWKPMIRPQGWQSFEAEALPLSMKTQSRITLAPGDRLILNASAGQFQRKPYFSELQSIFRHTDRRLTEARSSGWTLTAPRFAVARRTSYQFLDVLLTLEANAGDGPVRQIRPKFVWWDWQSAAGNPVTATFRETFAYPAPAWKLLTANWSDSAEAVPKVRAWWATDWPADAVKMEAKYSGPGPMSFAPPDLPRFDVHVETGVVPRDRAKAHDVTDTVPCVVVQMEWKPGEGPYIAAIESTKVTGWEHRFYKDADREYYTGLFWGGVTLDAADYQVKVVSVPEFRKAVEQRSADGRHELGGWLREPWSLGRPQDPPFDPTTPIEED